MVKLHSLLVERYRPASLEHYVGNENIKKAISQYLAQDRKSTRLNSSHSQQSRMPSSA